MNCSIFSKNKGLSRKEGFTLIELIVVMAIASVIMTALVIQQSNWNDSLIVNTQTYEMALMIRQAQVYGLGVKEYIAGTGDKFNIGYGVYFDSDPTRYIFFADKNGDKNYDSGEEVEIKTLNRGVTISKLCGNTPENCSGLSSVNVLFFRPEPKANISFSPVSGFIPPATIYLQSPGGKMGILKIEANGQVSVTQ